jgi:hypothetical protein
VQRDLQSRCLYRLAVKRRGGKVNAGGDATRGTNVSGNVVVGGNVIETANVTGNLDAGGNVFVKGLSTVTGNVLSNGDVTVKSTVDGNVNYGVSRLLTVHRGGTSKRTNRLRKDARLPRVDAFRRTHGALGGQISRAFVPITAAPP